MADKILNTRIQLKYDTYANWSSNNPVLKAGEMAIATVAQNQTNLENTGFTNLPNIVLKVGDGVSHYNDLKFVSALAADVHGWAKAANKPTYSATEIEGLDQYIAGEIQDTDTQYTIVPADGEEEGAAYKFHLKSKGLNDANWTTVATIDLSHIDTRLDALEEKMGNKKVTEQVADAINALNADEVKAEAGYIIDSVSESAGVVTVTKRELATADFKKDLINQEAVIGLADSLAAAAKAGTDAAAQALTDAKKYADDKVTAAVEALDNNDVAVENEFVTAVHEVNGIVTVERAQATIANISGLETRLAGIEGDITDLENNKQDNLAFEGTYDAANNKVVTKSAMTAAIEALDYEGGAFGEHKFATKVTEADGVIAVEYAQPAVADIDGLAGEISRLDGRIDTKQDALTFTSAPNTTDNRVATEKFVLESVADLNGAMHFVGALDAIPTENDQYTAGDVILVGYDEYVFDGTEWKALGNESIYQTKALAEEQHKAITDAMAALEKKHDDEMDALEKKHDDEMDAMELAYKTAIQALDKDDAAVEGQFVTAVSEADGVITVTRAALKASDIPTIEQSQVNGLEKALADLETAVGDGNDKTLQDAKDYADGKVKAAIEALDADIVTVGAGEIVESVKQVDGVVTVTTRALATEDFAKDLINQDSVIGLIDALDAAAKAGTDAAAKALADAKEYSDGKLDTAIKALDYADTEVEKNVVTAVSEADGVIAVTRKPLADIAWSGNVNDLQQTEGEYIVLYCGNSFVGAANEFAR